MVLVLSGKSIRRNSLKKKLKHYYHPEKRWNHKEVLVMHLQGWPLAVQNRIHAFLEMQGSRLS
jgi:hypothetical protein